MNLAQIARLQSLAEYAWFSDGDSEKEILRKLSLLMEQIETEEPREDTVFTDELGH